MKPLRIVVGLTEESALETARNPKGGNLDLEPSQAHAFAANVFGAQEGCSVLPVSKAFLHRFMS
jgi:hypothetical protein